MDTWEKIRIVKEDSDALEIVITSMPGKHTLIPHVIRDTGEKVGLHFIPPVMGSMVSFKAGGTHKTYNMYFSGDTLYYDELKVSFRFICNFDTYRSMLTRTLKKSFTRKFIRNILISILPSFIWVVRQFPNCK